MNETKTVQTPWLVKTYSAQLEQSASNLDTKIGTALAGLTESANWNLAYTEVSNESAKWNSVYGTVENNSAKFSDGYDSLNENSGNWNSVHSTVSNTSGKFNDGYSSLSLNSGNWNTTYTDLSENSAKWNSVYTDFESNSASFIQTYSAVSANSATWSNPGITSVYTDGNTVSGDGTEESPIGLLGPQYNMVAGKNMSITPSGNDLIFDCTAEGGGTGGAYLPLSGGVVSGINGVYGTEYYNQFVATRKNVSYSAFFGVGSDGRAFMKSSLDGRPELKLTSTGLIFSKDNSFNKLIPSYSADEVAKYAAFGFDKDGNPVGVQTADKYVKYVDPIELSGEMKITTLRGIDSSEHIPSTTSNGTLWVVVSAVE